MEYIFESLKETIENLKSKLSTWQKNKDVPICSYINRDGSFDVKSSILSVKYYDSLDFISNFANDPRLLRQLHLTQWCHWAHPHGISIENKPHFLIAELRGKTYNICCSSYTITIEGVTTSGDLIHAVKKIAKE